MKGKLAHLGLGVGLGLGLRVRVRVRVRVNGMSSSSRTMSMPTSKFKRAATMGEVPRRSALASWLGLGLGLG